MLLDIFLKTKMML